MVAVGFRCPVGTVNDGVSGAVHKIAFLLHILYKLHKEAAESRQSQKRAPVGNIVGKVVFHRLRHLCFSQELPVNNKVIRQFDQRKRCIEIDHIAEAPVKIVRG